MELEARRRDLERPDWRPGRGGHDPCVPRSSAPPERVTTLTVATIGVLLALRHANSQVTVRPTWAMIITDTRSPLLDPIEIDDAGTRLSVCSRVGRAVLCWHVYARGHVHSWCVVWTRLHVCRRLILTTTGQRRAQQHEHGARSNQVSQGSSSELGLGPSTKRTFAPHTT